MSEFPNMRPSDAKKEWIVQTMSVNARMHKLVARSKDGQMTEVGGDDCLIFTLHLWMGLVLWSIFPAWHQRCTLMFSI
jgi:hypothetical protein